jgi:hypothetical protein
MKVGSLRTAYRKPTVNGATSHPTQDRQHLEGIRRNSSHPEPTKWLIWTLSKFGLVSKLRRVPTEKIVLAELAEAQRRLKTPLA